VGVKQVTWCGENASVDCSATTIERPLDATQYFNQTGEPVWFLSVENKLIALKIGSRT